MSDKQILEKAIQKAIDGGWDHEDYPKTPKDILEWHEGNANDFIWRHDFAKALWGEEPMDAEEVNMDHEFYQYRWKSHLQRMVIADNPIQYLGEHLDD